MATEVERLKKELATLEAKRVELEKKQTSNRQQIGEVKNKRSELLLRAAEGDDGAKRDKRSLDHEYRDLVDADETFVSAIAEIKAKVESKSRDLRRAERAAVIESLEREIAGLDTLNVKVNAAVRELQSATAGLLSACDAVSTELSRIDATRYDGQFSYKLRSTIKEGVLRTVIEIGEPLTGEVHAFVDAVKVKLRSALAQLAWESLEGKITLVKGERLYRTNGHIGLRGVQLPPGSLFALFPEEAAEHVRTGYLIEETQPAA